MSEQQTLIKGAAVYDPSSGKEGTISDILLSKGHIFKIGKRIPSKDGYRVIDAKGMIVIPGLFDLRVRTGDPGFEHKEDLITVTNAAAAGGITGFAVVPDTHPVVQSKSIVDYIRNRTANTLTQVEVLGAATDNLAGEELSELYDLKLAGVKGYSNGDVAYTNPGVLKRILMYTKEFGMPVFTHAEEASLVQNGSVNESEVTIHTGLKTRPSMAEYMEVRWQVDIVRYTGGHLHFSHITCAESVDIIRKARKEGLHITCDVSIYHLAFTDRETLDFDSNYKILPPLRTEIDRKALIKGVKDGTIDAIVSDHNPQNVEEKKKEFDFAAFGAIGVQTLLPMYEKYLSKELSYKEWLLATVVNPRKILGLEIPEIEEGRPANLVVLETGKKWLLNKASGKSRSGNHPLWNKELSGMVKFVCNGKRDYLV